VFRTIREGRTAITHIQNPRKGCTSPDSYKLNLPIPHILDMQSKLFNSAGQD